MKRQFDKRRVIHHCGRSYSVIEELQVNGRRYDVLAHLGRRHRPRLLLHDPITRYFRIALVLKNNDATNQHLHALKRLPQLGELPHIVDVERKRDGTTILLKWIQGIDLEQYLGRVNKKPSLAPTPYESIRIVRGLTHALLQLHNHAQIVHGDLKPDNLILTRKTSRLVMVDFGNAWPIESTTYRAEGDGISSVYSAPEVQQAGDQSLLFADQFSTGVILYRLLTSEVPYEGLGGRAGCADYRADFRNSLVAPSKSSESIRRLPRVIGRRIDRLLARMLAFSIDDRFPTDSLLVEEIETLFLELKLYKTQPARFRSAWQTFLDQWFEER